MSETVTHIVANGGNRPVKAPARPTAEKPQAAETRQPAPAQGPSAGWVPVVTPGTTAVVIALVSEHGVIATVPAQTTPEALAAAKHQVDVRT